MPDYPCLALIVVLITQIIIFSRRFGKVEGKVEFLCRLVKRANGFKEEEGK